MYFISFNQSKCMTENKAKEKPFGQDDTLKMTN